MSNKVTPQASGPQQSKGGNKGQQASGQQSSGGTKGQQAPRKQPKRGSQGQQVKAWVSSPGSLPGCPEGLEYLAQIDVLVVKQQFDMLEYVGGWEMENKYIIYNKHHKKVYFAQEKAGCLMRQCCGPARGFQISITDNSNKEVIRISREFKCCAGCCWCAFSDCGAYVVTIEAPPGTTVGYVRQECSLWRPNFCLYTVDDDVLARIHGPGCVCNEPCCGDIEFTVMSPDDSELIGRIAKHWTGDLREWVADADTFTIAFPMDMDVRLKAVMMGALFLIDFMYFEKSTGDKTRRRRR